MTILIGPGRQLIAQAEGARLDYVLDISSVLDGDTITSLTHTAVGMTVEDLRVLDAPIAVDGVSVAVGRCVGFWASDVTKVLPARLRLLVTSSSGRVIPLTYLAIAT